MTSNSKILEERFRILLAVYGITKGHRIQHVWLVQIREYLNYNDADEDKILDLCNYLKNEGLLEFKYIGTGIVITNYGIKEVEEAIVNPNFPTINFPPLIVKSVEVSRDLYQLVQDSRRARTEFLQELYRITSGNESNVAYAADIAKNIKMDEPTWNRVYWYLQDEGLIKFRFNGGGISITHLGIKTIEDSKHQNQETVDAYVSTIGLEHSVGYRNDLPQEVNRLIGLSIRELVKEEESSYLEFKSSLFWDYNLGKCASKDLQFENIKAIPAFMNSHGGLLGIGIDKHNNNLLGLQNDFDTFSKNKNFDTWRQTLSSILLDRHKMEPLHLQYMEVNKKEDGNIIFAVIIVKKFLHPVLVEHNGQEPFYIRNGNRTISLEGKKLVNYVRGFFGSLTSTGV
jgi:hypothetical protein